MAIGKKNVVKTDPFSYNIGLIGEGGIGKTTIIKEMCEKYLGEDGYLFAECGKEDGADAIQDINYTTVIDWDSDYDEAENTVGLETLVDDIIENKTTEYPNLRVLVVDTYDQLFDLAAPEVVRLANNENPEKKVKSINAAYGGFGKGNDKAIEIVLDKLWELKRVGVHFIAIGHVKCRDVTDPVTGETYTQVTTDMQMKAFNALKNKLHFLGVATIDRQIVKQKQALKAGQKKPDEKGIVTGTTRKITFRDDNYSLDAKSRFADIEGVIEFDPDVLYQTLVDAIENEIKSKGKSVEDNKKIEDAKLAEREKKIAEAEEQKRAEKQVADVVDQIVAFFAANKSDKKKLTAIIGETKKLGYANPKMITNIEDAKAILALCE